MKQTGSSSSALLRWLIAVALVCFAASGAAAATFTVDFTKPDKKHTPGSIYGNQSYCRTDSFGCLGANGFNFQVSVYASYVGLGLDDDSSLSESFVFQENLKTFSVHSVEVVTANGLRPFQAGPGQPPTEGSLHEPGTPYYEWAHGSYDGIQYGLYGLRNGAITGTYEFSGVDTGKSICGPSACTTESPITIALDDGFSDIDALWVAIRLPEGTHSYYDGGWGQPPMTPGFLWCPDYCTNFALSEMEVTAAAPIPLPASLPLAVTGVVLLSGQAWRRRTAA